MTVSKACTRLVVTAHPEDTVQAVAKRMAQYDVGSLIVVEANKPVGIITDRDLVLRVIAQGHPSHELAVRAVMTGNPVCVPEHMPMEEAIALMRGYQIRRLVVVNDAKQLVGILSLDDLLLLLGEEQHAVAGLMRVARRQEGETR
jgi:CBS domain-containing protein